jgi:hypothetical protein
MTLDPVWLRVHLQIAGLAIGALVPVNLYVPSRYRWREELQRLSLLNRQIFIVHAAFLVLTLALTSALLLTCADTLLEPTRLSRTILGGLTIFWTVRLLAQWLYYSRRFGGETASRRRCITRFRRSGSMSRASSRWRCG